VCDLCYEHVEYATSVTQSVGKARIGGKWTGVDHHGMPVSALDFYNKFVLLYFGFTNCPDICPTELEKMSVVMRKIGKSKFADYVQPVFISVDPKRDSVATIAEYVQDFPMQPPLVGVTGTFDQVLRTTRMFRVYFSKANESEEEGEEDDYLLDHSIIMYLMNPEGEFADFFGSNMDADEVEEKVMRQIRIYMQEKGIVEPQSNSVWERAKHFLTGSFK